MFLFRLFLFKKMPCAFVVTKKQWRSYQNKHFSSQKNYGIFHIFDQIKVSRVPLQIGHCHFCMEGRLKSRLQSLLEIVNVTLRDPSLSKSVMNDSQQHRTNPTSYMHYMYIVYGTRYLEAVNVNIIYFQVL